MLCDAFDELRRDNMDPTTLRHFQTLVDLLAHTVANHHRDNSTECRYITLLEVMLSYRPGWTPSEQLSRFWVRLMQRIPADVPPWNFRRKAYRVLVSLSWVPSSMGLLQACSFDETPPPSFDTEGSPEGARAVLSKLRNQPLPRHDCVNQLLDRLKDETDVCVAITSEKEGTGKTTLAALVAVHPSIQKVFTVLWLSFENVQVMDYDTYVKRLNDLCGQLDIEFDWPESVKRFEEPALRQLREELSMKQLREQMSDLLLERDLSVLLILDDVTDARIIEWFRFNERLSIIVTTLDPSLEGVDWTVELDPMMEDEAIALFLNESNFPPSHILGSTLEVRSVVQRCECHPLTVRSLARWFHLKQVTAGPVDGLMELVDDLQQYASENRDDISIATIPAGTSTILFDILTLMVGPSRIEDGNRTSVLFAMCFAAMAAVFPEDAPLDAVLLLWEQILRVEPLAIDELCGNGPVDPIDIPKHAWFIAEGLTHMGLITVEDKDQENPWVKVHHKQYKLFALYMAREMDLAETFEETAEEWNNAFVTAYFEQRIQGDSESVDDNSWEYAIEKLPAHMLLARMYDMTETILIEENFFRARIEAIGWDRAIDVHIDDCIKLQQAIELDLEHSASALLSISVVFERLAVMVSEQAEGLLVSSEASFIVEVSKALYKIGFALSENGYIDEGIAQFQEAQSLLPQSQHLRASINYALSKDYLVNRNYDQAHRKIRASIKIMKDMPDEHVLYKEALQLYGDIMLAMCDYKNAASFFDETIEQWRPEKATCAIEFGNLLGKKGRLHHFKGELDTAKNTLNESVNWKLELGESSMSLTNVLSNLGDVYMELRQFPEAREDFEKAIGTLDALNCDHNSLGYLLLNGKLQFLQNSFTGSFQSLEKARAAIKEDPVLLMDQSAYCLRSIARIYEARGDFDSAVAILHESLALTDQEPVSLERSCELMDLAMYRLENGHVREGLASLEQSLEIQIPTLGECHQILQPLVTKGEAYMKLGSYDDALTAYEEVLDLTRRISEDDIDAMARLLYSIGDVYVAKEDYSTAVTKFVDSMEMLRRNRSDVHPDIAKSLQRLGDLTTEKASLEKAHGYYTEALRIRRMNFDEPLLAESLHSLGVVNRKRGDYKAANTLLAEALEIRKKLELSHKAAETLFEFGNLHRAQRETEDALSLYEKSLELLDKNGELHGSVLLAIGHIRLSLGDYPNALEYYEGAREIRLRVYGKDDIKAGNTSRSLALVKYLLTKGEEALVHLNDFVRICEDNAGPYTSSVDYALVALLLGDVYQARDMTERAQNAWCVAKEVFYKSKETDSSRESLVAMIDGRLEGVNVDPAKGNWGSARLRPAEEETEPEAVSLHVDTWDAKMLQKVFFIDD